MRPPMGVAHPLPVEKDPRLRQAQEQFLVEWLGAESAFKHST